MLIGITGTDGSGKGTVVDYLVKKKGFVHYSASELFAEELRKRNIEPTRPNLRLMANELRKNRGNDYIVVHYLEKMKKDGAQNTVIESIRALSEAYTLKKKGGTLVAVDADEKIRYERVQSRRSGKDKVSFEQFLSQEEMEIHDPDPHGMQKRKVMEIADHTVLNNGSLGDLHKEIEQVLLKLS